MLTNQCKEPVRFDPKYGTRLSYPTQPVRLPESWSCLTSYLWRPCRLFFLSASSCRVMLCGGWFQITRLSLVVWWLFLTPETPLAKWYIILETVSSTVGSLFFFFLFCPADRMLHREFQGLARYFMLWLWFWLCMHLDNPWITCQLSAPTDVQSMN